MPSKMHFHAKYFQKMMNLQQKGGMMQNRSTITE